MHTDAVLQIHGLHGIELDELMEETPDTLAAASKIAR